MPDVEIEVDANHLPTIAHLNGSIHQDEWVSLVDHSGKQVLFKPDHSVSFKGTGDYTALGVSRAESGLPDTERRTLVTIHATGWQSTTNAKYQYITD